MRSTKIIKICSSSLCTCLHHMVILRTRNKITDFFMISAWASPFKIGIHYEIKISIICIMFIKNNNIIVRQAQHICTAPIQRRTSVEDAGPMLHQCHTNALRPLRGSTGPVPVLCWRTKNQHRLSTSYTQRTRRLDQRWGKAVLALTTLSKLCSRIGPPPAPVCIVLLC